MNLTINPDNNSQKNNKDQYTEFVNRGLISFADLNDMLSEYKYKVKQESIEKKKLLSLFSKW